MSLFKSTIVIWSDFDPRGVELSHLAQEAETGSAICTVFRPEPAIPTDEEQQDIGEFFTPEDVCPECGGDYVSDDHVSICESCDFEWDPADES